MDDLSVDDIALQLSDLEIALLLCLVAREHCLIETTEDSIHDVAKELALICSNTFDLSYAILDCSSATTFDDLCSAILASDGLKTYEYPSNPWIAAERTSSPNPQEPRDHHHSGSPIAGHYPLDHRHVVNVIIAKDFNHVNEYIQIQILELLRSKQLITKNAVLGAPNDFLFVPLVSRISEQFRPPLNPHLNDHLFISHFHDSSNGYVHLEDSNGWLSDGQESVSSVVRKPEIGTQKRRVQSNGQLLEKLRQGSTAVTVGADVIRYQHDIVISLRLNRAVAGGISPKANSHFSRFAKLLALLHGTDYLTPSIIALAAKKVFRHRIILARPEDDRSLQYGSDLDAVAQVLAHVTASFEMVLEDVISEVEAPV